MKEICIDARMLGSTGIGTYLKNLIYHFQKIPFNVKLIVHPSACTTISWLERFELIFCTAPIYSIEEQWKLPVLIPSCDLFWSPHFNMPLLPIRARKRLMTIHDAFHFAFFSKLSLAQKAYVKLVIPNAIKKSERIITNSHFSKMELMKYSKLKEEKISVIHLGANPTHFKMKPPTKYVVPEKYILFVGTSKPHKNLHGLVNAFYELKKKGYDDLSLVVVGKDRFSGWRNSSILFLENVEDEHMHMLYHNAAVTVFPSFYEGFGLPPLEAMTCGCPVIASKAASIPEICGDAALYIDPLDIQDLSRSIISVLENQELRNALIQKGAERSTLFRWEHSAEQHLEIFERMCR